MRSTDRYQAFRIIGIALWIWGCFCCECWAEIRMDGTLGPAGALQGPDYQISANLGRQMGGNLFHSFEVLSIDMGESATFSGPATVATVIGRVTGGVSSRIDGNLACAIDGADVYLINPAGVVFGENASLEMSGGFHVSTADYLRLGDQGRFDATHPENSTLTTAPPEGFGFLDGEVASITVNAVRSGLWVADGAVLSIVGGDVALENADIGAPSGRINVAAVGSAGELSLEDMNTDHFQAMGAVAVTDARLYTSGDGAGDVYIRGGQLVVDNGHIEAETWGASDGGVIDLDIKGDVLFTNNSSIWGSSYGTGHGVDIIMSVYDLRIIDESAINMFGFGSGDGGTLRIASENSVEISNGGYIYARATADGDASDIFITANETMNVIGFTSEGQEASSISSSTVGMGDAGSINIEAGNCVMSQGAWLYTMSDGWGDAGDISIMSADTLEILDESFISSATLGSGNGGAIKLDVPRIEVSGYVSSSSLGSGNAGEIQINANMLELLDYGRIDVSTFGSGSGGKIEITTDRLILSQGGISAILCYECFDSIDPVPSPEEFQTAGDIIITAGELVYLTGIDVREGNIEASDIASSTTGNGNGGSIHIQTPEFIIENGASLVASNVGAGDAGDIFVNADNRITMTHWAGIYTQAVSGNGGNITLIAQEMLYLEDSQIKTDVWGGQGSGGDIRIDPRFVILNGSEITANAYGGNGGNIHIITEHFIQDSVSIIDASSQLGIDGDVDIASPDIDFSDIATLSTDFMDTNDLNTHRCVSRNGDEASSLIVTGRGGLLPRPENYLATLVSDMK